MIEIKIFVVAAITIACILFLLSMALRASGKGGR